MYIAALFSSHDPGPILLMHCTGKKLMEKQTYQAPFLTELGQIQTNTLGNNMGPYADMMGGIMNMTMN